MTPEVGALVDPTDDDALFSALGERPPRPRPNLAGRAAAGDHDVKLQAVRIEEILERAAEGRRA